MTWWVDNLMLLWGAVGWLLLVRENSMKRDVYTDLSQIMHDYGANVSELRRTEGHESFIETLPNSVKGEDDD